MINRLRNKNGVISAAMAVGFSIALTYMTAALGVAFYETTQKREIGTSIQERNGKRIWCQMKGEKKDVCFEKYK